MITKSYAMKRLQASCNEKGPLCIGLDTDPSYLPPHILQSFESPAKAVLAYNRALIDATAEFAGCYKVQIAYYEAMGIEGLQVYSETLKAIRAANIPVIADIKRGDIADTAKAYARAHFTGDFEADIVTINPYMGFDTLEPFLEYVESAGKGAFVLLRTSNPGMKDLEWLKVCETGDRLFHSVGSALSGISERFSKNDEHSCAPFGAVVGCTEEHDAREIRDRYPDIFFLIPGYGAQGGAAKIAATLLDHAGGTVNSSRGILLAWKKDPLCVTAADKKTLTLDEIVASARQAASAARDDLLRAKKEFLSQTSVPRNTDGKTDV